MDCPPPEFEILKTCDACTINPETGKPNCQCQITVTSNGAPFTGNLSVNEGVVFGGSTPFNDTITAVSSTDSWTCDQPPFAPARPGALHDRLAGADGGGEQLGHRRHHRIARSGIPG